MDIQIRRERPQDYTAVERLTYDAFLNVELPGRQRCDEHYLVHLLRQSEAFVPELNCVAEVDGRLAGHIIYARSTLEPLRGEPLSVLTFGPLSVAPDMQGRGIGGALVRHTVAEAARLGWPSILIYGHPSYYPRFGFEPARNFGITSPEGEAPDAFLCLPLSPGALEGKAGHFHIDPVYNIDPAGLDAWEAASFRR